MENADFLDQTAKRVFGVTKTDAIEKGICVQCRELAMPKCYSDAGIREYPISGLCELCFDEIMQLL